MLKHVLLVLMAAGLMMGSSGCTSKKATDEEATADVAEVAGEGDGLDVGTDEVAAADDAAAELGGDELSADEQLPEDGDVAAAEGDDFATPAEELAENPEKTDPAKDDMAAMEEPMTEPTPEPTSEPPPTTVDESLAAGETTPEPEAAMPMSEEPAKPLPPLRKIADMPYEQNGLLVNAVYIARKGDTWDGVTSKIYGTVERKKELAKLNPTIKNREVKVGDKIYYNSPQRPTDNQKLLTYYEDMGLAPETYAVTKPENIRTIAKNLLGDTNSWKELWATNLDLESKGELAEGTQLRYWAGAPASTVAQAEVPPPTEMAPPVDPSAAAPVEQAPPPPPPIEQPVDQMAAAPPPADPNAAAGTMDQAPPPPPADLPPPPPPPPPADTQAAAEPPTSPGVGGPEGVMNALENPDQTMAMGAGAILLLGAVAIFIMIRKRKARRQIDFHTSTQTQIE